MNAKSLIYNTSIAICLLLFFSSCEKQGGNFDESKPNNNATLSKWLGDVSFQKVTVTNASAGYKDIVFNKDNAAVLDTRNIVFFSYNNGNSWEQKLSLSGNTFQCIALQPDGKKLFIGGISLGNYTFGAKFWVYHTPDNGTASLDYTGEAKMVNTDDPINSDFMRTSWNGDGSVYASFGRTTMKDGFFGNITPDGRKIFTRRTPSFSWVLNESPTKFPTHCQGFSISDTNKTLTLSASEYISSGNIGLMAAYTSGDGNKGAGNNWLNITNYWKPGLSKHIAEDMAGNYAVIIGDANRFFVDSKLLTEKYVEVVPKGISGTMYCTAIDNNQFIWIGTDNGLYKSNKPLPKLYNPFG